MSREAQIPLVLWISAAIVAHWMGGNGAIQIARVYEDRAQIRSFVDGVRFGLRPADTTFEILTDTTLPTPPAQPLAAPAEEAPDLEPGEPDPNAIAAKPKKLPEPKPKPRDERPPPEPIAKTPPKPPEPPKPTETVTVPAGPPPPPPPPDHRIAIRQNTPKNQEDNPNAPRIADSAHHTKDETVARIRSRDHDDPNPTLGRPMKAGPKDEVGDSDEHKLAHSEEKKGNPDRAPGEASKTRTSTDHHAPQPPEKAPIVAKANPATDPGSKAVQGGGKAAEPAIVAKAAPPPSPGGAGPASPEVITGTQGGYSLDPANPGGDGKSRKAGRKHAAPYQSPVRVGSLGLGAPAVEGGPNLNLTMAGVEKAVGKEQLRAEREADGAARRSAHRGSWEKNKFERWRAAIENYDPSVKLGNQTSLNAAAVPFASYLNSIHNRLHQIFADEFLAALDNLPPEHFLNDQDLVTHLEIVLSKDDGRIVRMGVAKPSGVTAFDIVALNSVERASPYGKAPDVIASPDGNVYLHWEFHRDGDMCGTHNARPYLLKAAPEPAPLRPLAPKKAPMPRSADERNNSPGPLLPRR